MEIKILKNVVTKRLILVDKQTGQAFFSFGKDNKMYEYFTENHEEEIEDYKPGQLKTLANKK